MSSNSEPLGPVAGAQPAGSTAMAVAIFALLLASYGVNAMDRQLFPLILANVQREYSFSLANAGLLSTVFTFGMAIAGVPTGYLLARYTRKATTQIGIALFSAATILTVASGGFGDMLLWRALTGVGEAMQLTALLAIASSYFTRYRSAAVGAVNFSFGIGAIIGPALGAFLLRDYGTWRAPMIVFGLIGIAAILVIALFVPSWLSEARTRSMDRMTDGGADTLLNHNTSVLLMLSVIGGLIIYGYLGMYPTFLRQHLHFSPMLTGETMSIYGLGVLASIGGGWLGDRFSPRPVLGGSFLIAAVLGYVIFHGDGSFAEQAGFSFVWGLVVSGTLYVNLAGYHVKSVRGTLTGRASGLFVTSLYGAACVAGYLIGSLASRGGWSLAGTVQITALGVIGALLSLTLKPRGMALGRR